MNKNEFDNFNELFSLETYQKFLESKRVRPIKEQTQTELDFIMLEEEEELRRKGKLKTIADLKEIDPTPNYLKKHFTFIRETFTRLFEDNPKDEFLIALSSSEQGITIKYSYDWYKRYGIDYNFIKN